MTPFEDRALEADGEPEEEDMVEVETLSPAPPDPPADLRSLLTFRNHPLRFLLGGSDVGSHQETGSAPSPIWFVPSGWDGAFDGRQDTRNGTGSSFDECLAGVVESDLLPRLLAARKASATEPPDAIAEPDMLDRFCRILLADGLEGAMSFLEAMMNRGVSIADIYSGYVAGGARRLGALWEDDVLSFAEVTTGLSRLHGIVRRLSPGFASSGRDGANGRSALFAVTPGETHALGVVIAAEHFARAGWRLRVDLDPKLGELTRLVARERFDVVGFSISADRYVGRLHEAMSAVRRANPAALVVVGGSLFAERPELADELRPDFVAADAESASRAMTSILDTAGRSAT